MTKIPPRSAGVRASLGGSIAAIPEPKSQPKAGGAVAEAGVSAKVVEKQPASAETVQQSRARMISGEGGARLSLDSKLVQNALTTGDPGSTSEQRRSEQEGRAEQERRIQQGQWPAAPTVGPAPTRDPNDLDARTPLAPAETTVERASRLNDEMMDPAKLKPGESVKVKIGGGGSAVVVKGESVDQMEMKRNQDGTYTVTVDGETAKGLQLSLGGKAGKVGLNGSGEVTQNDRHKVEFKVANAEEAKQLASALRRKALADRAKEMVPGGSLLPDPITSSEQQLINKSIVATETTSGRGLGFAGTAGAADKQLPVQLGVNGENKGTDTLTTRTEYEKDDNGEPYAARVIENRVFEANRKVDVGLGADSNDVQVTSGSSLSKSERRSKHELETTRHLPKPGSDEVERTTVKLRETQESIEQVGNKTKTTRVIKEQDIDPSAIDQQKLLKIFVAPDNDERKAQMRTLPASSTKVTVENEERASTGAAGPYNANVKKRSETFEIDPARQSEIFTHTDADAARLNEMRAPGAEPVVSQSEQNIEGAGSGGRIGIGVFGIGVEVEADIQKTTEVPPSS